MKRLRVSVFPGGFNWPIFAAIERGYFAQNNIQIALEATAGSIAQMTAFAAGEFEIAMTAFDNIVAYVEGAGEAPIGPQPDFFAFLGSDDSFLSLVGQRDIAEIPQLRAATVSVDAATTGYAFALFDILGSGGLSPGDYRVVRAGGMKQRFDDLRRGGAAATMLSAPYDLMAKEAGLRVIARFSPPYQGNVAAARRSWARANRDAVSTYKRAYVTALRWLHEPASEPDACELLQQNVPGMTREMAAASYSRMINQEHGFSRDGALNVPGMQRVIDLRTRYGDSAAVLNPSNYIDQNY